MTWCDAIWAIIAAPTVALNVLVSWLLDNVPEVAALWERVSSWLKRLILFAVAIGLTAGAYYAGMALFACQGWPPIQDVILAAIVAAAGYLAGGKRHEAAKRGEAEKLATQRKWREE